MSVITPRAPPQTLQGLLGKAVFKLTHPSKGFAAVIVGAACICLQSFLSFSFSFFFPLKQTWL